MKSILGKAISESKKAIKEDLIDDTKKMEKDHEVNMAKGQLYKSAKYAIELHNMLNKISEDEGLPGWVQAKITTASDYLSKVKHYMEYERKPENLELDIVAEPVTISDKDKFESLYAEYKQSKTK